MKIDRDIMKQSNLNLVLNVLRQEECTSQAEILAKTNLSHGSVCTILKSLKKKGLIVEVGTRNSSLGRRPKLLRFNFDTKFIVVVDVTINEIIAYLTNMRGDQINSLRQEYKHSTDPSKTIDIICGLIGKILGAGQYSKKSILAIGLCVEGNISLETGDLMYSALLGWENVPIKRLIEKRTAVPTFIATKPRAALLGEYNYGIAKSINDLVCIYVDHGIGSFAMSKGHIINGVHGMAGEIGHSVVDPNGPNCKCGLKGCLEMFSSGPGMVSRFMQLKLSKNRCRTNISAALIQKNVQKIYKLAMENDAAAKQVIDQAADCLAYVTANIVNYTDPGMVLFTGYMIYESQGLMLKRIRHSINKYLFPNQRRTIRLEEGTLQNVAILKGMVALICEEYFSSPVRTGLRPKINYHTIQKVSDANALD